MISEKFKMKEFARSGMSQFTDEIPEYVTKNLIALHKALLIVQCNMPRGTSLKIASGYRPKWYNDALIRAGSTGVSKKSYHIRGMASDLISVGGTFEPEGLYYLIKRMIEKKLIPAGGLGCYRDFVHYDIRGRLVEFRKPNGGKNENNIS